MKEPCALDMVLWDALIRRVFISNSLVIHCRQLYGILVHPGSLPRICRVNVRGVCAVADALCPTPYPSLSPPFVGIMPYIRTIPLSSLFFEAVIVSITSPILPPIFPSLLPQIAIKLGLAQLYIYHIMGPTHPHTQLILGLDFRLIPGLCHPGSKIFSADPARVEFGECGNELAHDGLGFGRRGTWICSCHAVQKCPGRATELFDIGRAVRARRRDWGGRLWFLAHGRHHRLPFSRRGTCPASSIVRLTPSSAKGFTHGLPSLSNTQPGCCFGGVSSSLLEPLVLDALPGKGKDICPVRSHSHNLH